MASNHWMEMSSSRWLFAIVVRATHTQLSRDPSLFQTKNLKMKEWAGLRKCIVGPGK